MLLVVAILMIFLGESFFARAIAFRLKAESPRSFEKCSRKISSQKKVY